MLVLARMSGGSKVTWVVAEVVVAVAATAEEEEEEEAVEVVRTNIEIAVLGHQKVSAKGNMKRI